MCRAGEICKDLFIFSSYTSEFCLLWKRLQGPSTNLIFAYHSHQLVISKPQMFLVWCFLLLVWGGLSFTKCSCAAIVHVFCKNVLENSNEERKMAFLERFYILTKPEFNFMNK